MYLVGGDNNAACKESTTLYTDNNSVNTRNGNCDCMHQGYGRATAGLRQGAVPAGAAAGRCRWPGQSSGGCTWWRVQRPCTRDARHTPRKSSIDAFCATVSNSQPCHAVRRVMLTGKEAHAMVCLRVLTCLELPDLITLHIHERHTT